MTYDQQRRAAALIGKADVDDIIKKYGVSDRTYNVYCDRTDLDFCDERFKKVFD